VWDGKGEDILESEKYTTLTVTLQKTLWSMTVDFRYGSSNFRHKTFMTKFHFIMD
jgi:hypothetical protein